MPKYTYIPMVALLTTLGACQLDAKNIGTPDSASEATASATSTDTTANPTETGGGVTDTSTTDISTTGEPGDTDPTGEPGDTETTGEPGDTDDTDTTGNPGLCPANDPATSAAFKVKLDAWPDQSDDNHDFERACTIDAVSSDQVTVTTALTCDVDGVPLAASFEIAVAPEGNVDWGVGQAVILRSRVFLDEFGDDLNMRMTTSNDPAALLVDGQHWWGDDVPESQAIGPILREISNVCDGVSEDTSFGLTYSLTGGANVSIGSGRRGTLPIDGTHTYAIDLAHSGVDQFHGNEHSLIRRVTNG